MQLQHVICTFSCGHRILRNVIFQIRHSWHRGFQFNLWLFRQVLCRQTFLFLFSYLFHLLLEEVRFKLRIPRDFLYQIPILTFFSLTLLILDLSHVWYRQNWRCLIYNPIILVSTYLCRFHYLKQSKYGTEIGFERVALNLLSFLSALVKLLSQFNHLTGFDIICYKTQGWSNV